MILARNLWGLVLVTELLWTSHTNGEPVLRQRIQRVSAFHAARYAMVHKIPVELVHAIIEVESGWKPHAVSSKGACRLMQLMPGTAAGFGVANRFNIEQNIRAGVEYLGNLTFLFKGDLRLVLAAYVAGEERI